MKTLAKLAAIAATAMLLAPAAHAGEYEDRLAELRTRFAAADRNRDGRLTRQETQAGGMSRVAQYFSRVDTDRDGYVTLAQLEAQLAARYQ